MPEPEPRRPVSIVKAPVAPTPSALPPTTAQLTPHTPTANTGGGQLVPRPMAPAVVHPAPHPGYVPGYAAGPRYAPGPGYPVPAPQSYPVTTSTVVVQQSNAEIVIAWIFTALTLLYMLPWAIAATRRSTNSIIIAVATFFFAWTVVGWLVMLVLSFLGPTVHTVRATTTYVPPQQIPPPSGVWAHCPTDPPHVQRWWDGHAWTAHTTVG